MKSLFKTYKHNIVLGKDECSKDMRKVIDVISNHRLDNYEDKNESSKDDNTIKNWKNQ